MRNNVTCTCKPCNHCLVLELTTDDNKENTMNNPMVTIWTLCFDNGQLIRQEMPRETAYWTIDNNSKCNPRWGGRSQWFGKGKFGFQAWDKDNNPTFSQWID
jgi:hypothetical protein